MKYQITQPKPPISTRTADRPVPIILRFRNRFLFLYLTVRSLEATGCPPDLLIDDCSTDAATLQYVYTNKEYKTLMPAWWPSDSTWTRCVGEMPTYFNTTGIRGKYKVGKTPCRLGFVGGICYCVKKSFETFTEAKAIILVEADVVFCENWYNKLIERWQSQEGKIGIVSGFNADYLGFTAQLYLITREFFEECNGTLSASYDVRMTAGDQHLLKISGEHGLKNVLGMPSLCQHIGYKSEFYGRRGAKNGHMYVLSSHVDGRLCL